MPRLLKVILEDRIPFELRTSLKPAVKKERVLPSTRCQEKKWLKKNRKLGACHEDLRHLWAIELKLGRSLLSTALGLLIGSVPVANQTPERNSSRQRAKLSQPGSTSREVKSRRAAVLSLLP